MSFSLDCNVLENIEANHINVGDVLNFKATNLDLSTFHFSDVKKPWKLISVAPSLDTSVCLTQAETLNKQYENNDKVQLISITRDSVFAAARVCSGFLNEDHILITDYNYRDFGEKTGLFFADVQILCRAALILNENNKVVYLQIPNPITESINFKEVNDFLKEVISA